MPVPSRDVASAAMHLRRALLLFAIVLGLAAIVTSVSQPPGRDEGSGERPSPTVSPPAAATAGPTGPAKRIALSTTARRPRRAMLEAGRPAVVTVRVEGPGQVDVRGLGLTSAADSVTPARFDVLAERPSGYSVDFTPAGAAAAVRVGMIVVTPRQRASRRPGPPDRSSARG